MARLCTHKAGICYTSLEAACPDVLAVCQDVKTTPGGMPESVRARWRA